MRAIIVGLVLAAAVPGVAFAQMGPGGGMPGGGGGREGGGREGGWRGGGEGGMRRGQGRPMMRAIEIKRDRLDKLVTDEFREADANRDGFITAEEVRGVLEARRDAELRERFAAIDTNHDQHIDVAEFLAWQRSLGSGTLEEDASLAPQATLAAGIEPGGKDDGGDRVLRRLLGPLDGVALSAADSNYDGKVSLDELLAYARGKFDALDTDQDGKLTGEELRSVMGGGRRGGFGGAAAGARPGPNADRDRDGDDDGE